MKERVEKLRKLLSDNGLDAALVTGLTAIRYYSGFTSDEAALVVTGAHASLLTDFRYTIQAKEQSPDFDVVEVGRGALLPTVDRLLKEDGAKRVAFENHTMTVATFEKYKALEYEFVPFSEEMNKPRLFKTADEIASLQKAQNLADEGLKLLLTRIGSGMTEKEVAAELVYCMLKYGSEGNSFDPIVVTGKNTSLPHGVPGDAVLQPGDFVTMDFGSLKDGYCSDMTRTVAVCSATDEMKNVYDTVLRAQLAGIAAARSGILGKEIDQASRKVINDAGFGEYFGHGFGHCLGLDIHEPPFANPRGDVLMPENSVSSAEPGIYLPGRFGVRIEDVMILRPQGSEVITLAPKKELILVGN